MGRAKHSTKEERTIIIKLRNEGKNHRKIAETIGRSQNFTMLYYQEKQRKTHVEHVKPLQKMTLL